jgi:hypothetical protein
VGRRGAARLIRCAAARGGPLREHALRISAVLACLLAGCGGGAEERRPAATPNTEPIVIAMASPEPGTVAAASSYRWKPATRPTPIVVKGVAPVVPAPATAEETTFTVEDEEGVKSDSFELSAVHGRGFPALKVTFNARRIGESLASPVRPVCSADAKCEYALARKYLLTLSDDRLLQLVPRGEGVAVIAREMSVDVPKAVHLQLMVEGNVISRRRIVLTSD